MKNFINPLSFGGLFLIFIALMSSIGILNKKAIKDKGLIVDVKILNPPSSCEDIPSKGLRIKFKYKDKTFIERINYKECSNIIGHDHVEMLTNEKEDKFYFLHDYKQKDFFYVAIIFILGVVIVFKGAQEKE